LWNKLVALLVQKRGNNMCIRKSGGGYKYGNKGKTYKGKGAKAKAKKQAAAAHANKRKG
jgi:hypothetical protein